MTLAAPNLRSGGMPNLASPSRSLSLRLQAQSHAQRPSRCSAGRSFTFTPRQPLAHPRHGILHEPWLSPSPAPASATPFPVAYFSPTWVHTGIDGLDGPQNNNHKPPDKRVLKLGKSEYKEINRRGYREKRLIDSSSSPNSLTSPPYHLVQYPPTRDPRPQRQPPPLPLNTPTPPHRQGPHIIPRSTVDSTSRLEQRPTRRQCEAPNPQRANSPRGDPS